MLALDFFVSIFPEKQIKIGKLKRNFALFRSFLVFFINFRTGRVKRGMEKDMKIHQSWIRRYYSAMAWPAHASIFGAAAIVLPCQPFPRIILLGLRNSLLPPLFPLHLPTTKGKGTFFWYKFLSKKYFLKSFFMKRNSLPFLSQSDNQFLVRSKHSFLSKLPPELNLPGGTSKNK